MDVYKVLDVFRLEALRRPGFVSLVPGSRPSKETHNRHGVQGGGRERRLRSLEWTAGLQPPEKGWSRRRGRVPTPKVSEHVRLLFGGRGLRAPAT